MMGGYHSPTSNGPLVGAIILLLAGCLTPLHAITQQDFFQGYGKGEILRQGDSEFEMVKLEPPMPFFSQTFDHIYVRIQEEGWKEG